MPAFEIETIAERDWVRASQAQFAPLEVGKRLWIGATWHRPPPNRIAVRIDPGLAFGTGSHRARGWFSYFSRNHPRRRAGPRLWLRLRHIGNRRRQARRKAGGRGGYRSPGCGTARANALANAVAPTAALPDALTAVDYDVIVANILAQPLIELAPLFARLGARVALSGILETQAAEVAQAYAPWFDMHIAGSDEGWVLLAGARK